MLTYPRLLTLGQVSFFLVNEFWRIGQGYPITTLELTTITFSFLMMGTSVGWYFKPVISSATVLRTRDNRTILDIRRTARTSVRVLLAIGFILLTRSTRHIRNFSILGIERHSPSYHVTTSILTDTGHTTPTSAFDYICLFSVARSLLHPGTEFLVTFGTHWNGAIPMCISSPWVFSSRSLSVYPS